jgi:hypothetical protein
MATAAFENYKDAQKAVADLLDLEATYHDPPPSNQRSLVEALRGGAAVLMVASFEQYLKEAIGEVVDRINRATPPCDFDKLPDNLRVSVVYTGLDRAMKGGHGDGGRPKIDRLPDVFTAIAGLHARKVNGATVAQTGGNPNPARVVSMFRAIGVSNVLSLSKRSFESLWSSPIASTFLSDQLEAIVSRRHIVAHTASVMSVSRTDLNNGTRFLSTLVQVFDGILERHSQRIITTAQPPA